jgi:hypothetical protein
MLRPYDIYYSVYVIWHYYEIIHQYIGEMIRYFIPAFICNYWATLILPPLETDAFAGSYIASADIAGSTKSPIVTTLMA